jgi:hypothetical protein
MGLIRILEQILEMPVFSLSAKTYTSTIMSTISPFLDAKTIVSGFMYFDMTMSGYSKLGTFQYGN